MTNVWISFATPGPQCCAGSINRGIHCEQARAVWSLPPKERREIVDIAGWPVAADVHKSNSAVRQARCQSPGLRRDVGCFCSSRYRHGKVPTGTICERVTTRKFFGPHQFALDAEWQRMTDDPAGLYSLIQSSTAFGCLSRPVLDNAIEDPAGARPNELFFGRQFFRCIDEVERAINHRSAIEVQDTRYSIGIADVEVRLAHYDYLANMARWRCG